MIYFLNVLNLFLIKKYIIFDYDYTISCNVTNKIYMYIL
jgi:hypothetical protein